MTGCCLLRDPYEPPRPVLEQIQSSYVFKRQMHQPVALSAALQHQPRMVVDATASSTSQLGGDSLKAQDVLSLDGRLAFGLGLQGLDDVSFSLNLCPVWQSPTMAPLYRPYDYSQKDISYVLFIQDLETWELTIKLLDKNDLVFYSTALRSPSEGK